MSASRTTKQARGADLTTFALSFVDQSGNGAGPFVSAVSITDASGNAFTSSNRLPVEIDASNVTLNVNSISSINVGNFPPTVNVGNFQASINIGNFPASQAVTGTFWQATQPVSLASLPALSTGANTIGSVGITSIPQSTYRVTVTPTVTAATYAANKVMGGILTFSNILPATTYAGILQSIVLKFKGSVQSVSFHVYVFDTSPSGTFTDTNTAAIAAGDSAYLIGAYQLTVPHSSLGTHTIYVQDGIGKAIQGVSQNLYVVIVPDATTAALGSTSDMIVSLGVLQG